MSCPRAWCSPCLLWEMFVLPPGHDILLLYKKEQHSVQSQHKKNRIRYCPNHSWHRIQISTTNIFWVKMVDEPIWTHSSLHFSHQQVSNFVSRYLTVISCRSGAHTEGGACSSRRGRCWCCHSFHRSVSWLGWWDGGRTSRSSTDTVLSRGTRSVSWK